MNAPQRLSLSKTDKNVIGQAKMRKSLAFGVLLACNYITVHMNVSAAVDGVTFNFKNFENNLCGRTYARYVSYVIALR